jgi:hypothetical protein
MRIRGVVFGSRSSGDPVRQITEIAPFRRSITSPVQEVRDARLVSNVQWFNGRQTGLDWNFTFEDSRSVEGQDRLEVQLATSSLMWIPSRLLKKDPYASLQLDRLAPTYCKYASARRFSRALYL